MTEQISSFSYLCNKKLCFLRGKTCITFNFTVSCTPPWSVAGRFYPYRSSHVFLSLTITLQNSDWSKDHAVCFHQRALWLRTNYGWHFLIGTSYLHLTHLVDKTSAILTRGAQSFGLMRCDFTFCFCDSSTGPPAEPFRNGVRLTNSSEIDAQVNSCQIILDPFALNELVGSGTVLQPAVRCFLVAHLKVVGKVIGVWNC